ncbi:hypothetical protein CIRG_09076 [Coccidioides immitis RMSCC 2394]|nr:hypothetical protein CIRG_09076 [Coccidioides immitis RMSCC 2394]
MPTLKQLTCHVEWAPTDIPFKEYGIAYGDGTVESYIAIPSTSSPFSVSLKSNGYIAPGLAMFVFMDGVYQCNRNRDDLIATEGKPREKAKGDRGKGARKGVNFRVRQKEEMRGDGKWIGRPWRFEPLQIIPEVPGMPDIGPKSHFDHLGEIMVIVLRCVPRNGGADGLSDGSRTPDSAMAPSLDPNDIDAALSDEEFEIAKAKYNKNPEPEPAPGVKPQLECALGDFSMLFDGANDGYYPSHRYQHQRHHHRHASQRSRRTHERDEDYCPGCDSAHHRPRNAENFTPLPSHSSSDIRGKQASYDPEPSESGDNSSFCARHISRTARYSSGQQDRPHSYHDRYGRHPVRRHSRSERSRSRSHSSDYHPYNPRELRAKPSGWPRCRHRQNHGKHDRNLSLNSELIGTNCHCSKCSRWSQPTRPNAQDARDHRSCEECNLMLETGPEVPRELSRYRGRVLTTHNYCPECDEGEKYEERDVRHDQTYNCSHPGNPRNEHDTHSRNGTNREEKVAYGTTIQSTSQGVPSIVLNVNPPSWGNEHSTCKSCDNQLDVANNGCYMISDGQKVPHYCRGPRTRAPNVRTWEESRNCSGNCNHVPGESPPTGVQDHSSDRSNGNQSSWPNHGIHNGGQRDDQDGRNRTTGEPGWDNGSNGSRNEGPGNNGSGNWDKSSLGPQDCNNNSDNRSNNDMGDDWANAGNRNTHEQPDWNNNETQKSWGGDNNGSTNESRWDSGNVENPNNESHQQVNWDNDNQYNGQAQDHNNWGNSDSNDNGNGGHESGANHEWHPGGSWEDKNNNSRNPPEIQAASNNDQVDPQPVPQQASQQAAQQGPWIPIQPYRFVAPNRQSLCASQVYYNQQDDEPPLYTVPEAIAQAESLSHQVQLGRAQDYRHKLRVPEYLDTMDEPYAKFVFKYRMQETIEQKFNVKVERDPEVERKKLEMLPKSDIVTQLLQAQGLISNQPTLNPVAPGQPEQSSAEFVQYGTNVGNLGGQNFRGYWPLDSNFMPPPPPILGAPGPSVSSHPANLPDLNNFSTDGTNSNGVPLPLQGIFMWRHPSYGYRCEPVMRFQSRDEKTSTDSRGHSRKPSVRSGSTKNSINSGKSSSHLTSSGNATRNMEDSDQTRGHGNGDPFQSRHSGCNRNTAGGASNTGDSSQSGRVVSGSSTGSGDPFQSRHANGNGNSNTVDKARSGDPFQSKHSQGTNRGGSGLSSRGGDPFQSRHTRKNGNPHKGGDPFRSIHTQSNGSGARNEGDRFQNGNNPRDRSSSCSDRQRNSLGGNSAWNATRYQGKQSSHDWKQDEASGVDW